MHSLEAIMTIADEGTDPRGRRLFTSLDETLSAKKVGNLHCVKSTVAFGLALCLLQSQVKQKVTLLLLSLGHPKNRLYETIMFTAMRMFNFYHYYD